MDFDDDDFPAPAAAKPASKFQPKAKPRPRPKKVSATSTTVTEKSFNAVSTETSQPKLDDSNGLQCTIDVQDFPICQSTTGTDRITLDTVGESWNEAPSFSNTEVIQSDQGGAEKEVSEDLIMAEGVCADPYTDCLLNQDDLLEPPVRVTPDFPNSLDPGTSFPLEQGEDLLESNQQNAIASENIYSEDMPGMLEQLDQSGLAPGSYSTEDFNDNAFATFASNANESENFLERQSQFDCLPDSTVNGNEGSSAEAPNQMHTNGQDNHDDINNEEGKVSRKKRSSQRSKKGASGKSTTIRKRKKKTEVAENQDKEQPVAENQDKEQPVAENQDKEQPPKRFPHSTRRKKRIVDQSLLEKDEDDIDFQRLPIKDLIILAEYRERQRKEPVASAQSAPEKCPTPTPTHNVMLEDDDNWGGDPFDFQNGPYADYQETTIRDDPSTLGIPRSTNYFNYHSHMNRKKVKWSKQDTELFYQGVQQFGSDLEMISRLFPDRERRHIKLKYKKEERQHPMRLHDALTTRAKDLTQFQRLIKILQEEIDKDEREQEAAEEEDQYGEPDNDGNLEDTDAAVHVNAAKFEQNGEEGVASVDEDPKTEVGEPKSSDRSAVCMEDDDEDDMDDFCQYKSML